MMKTKLTLTGISSVVIIAVALIILNLISVNVFGRLDLSEGEIYSLSQSSKEIVAALDDRITITCYFSDDIPQPYNANARYLKDQLDEYKAYAGGKLTYVFIDPVKEKKEQEAGSNGIPSVPINTIARDKMEIKQVFMGIVIQFLDKKEVIPVVQDVNTLEYEITRAIRRLTSSSTPKIAFLTGNGEHSPDSDLTYIDKTLTEEYQLQSLDLKQTPVIPGDVSTIFIVGPKRPLSDWELYQIDQFLMRGGKLGVLLDKVQAQIQQGQAWPVDPGLDPFLAHFGIKVNSNMVVDVQNAQIAVQQQRGMFRIQSLKEYPFFPRVNTFSKTNLIVKDLEAVNFIFASSIDTSGFTVPGLNYDILARTSKRSGIQTPPYNIDPFREWSALDFNFQQVPLGVAVTGEFKSYFAGKPKPSMDTVTASNLSTLSAESRLDSGSGGRLVVWGDADFVSDQVLRDRSNLILFQNMTDWLAQDEGLISIRSKEVTARPLKPVEDSTRTLVKYVNMFLMPIVVVIFGVARWQIRKQRRRRQLV